MSAAPSAFEKTPGWLDWDASPSKPSFVPPAGAVDAHCHVFGPGESFPYAPQRKYTPCDASRQQLVALRDEVGPFGTILMTATDCLNDAHKARLLESMRLMAEEVMPRFKRAIGDEAAA